MNKIQRIVLGACVATALAASPVWAESKMGTMTDDAMITTKVKSALVTNSNTKARNIEVETHSGVVQLNGFVESSTEKQAAEDSAKMVKGVTTVDNNLQVRGADRTAGGMVDDVAITTKVKAAMVSDSRIKARQVEVKTYNGVVSLGGTVATDAERKAAEEVASAVSGVVKVENGIVIGKG